MNHNSNTSKLGLQKYQTNKITNRDESTSFCQGVCFKLILINLGIIIAVMTLMNSVVIPIAETRVMNSKKEVAKSSVQVVHHLIQNFYNRYLLGGANG